MFRTFRPRSLADRSFLRPWQGINFSCAGQHWKHATWSLLIIWILQPMLCRTTLKTCYPITSSDMDTATHRCNMTYVIVAGIVVGMKLSSKCLQVVPDIPDVCTFLHVLFLTALTAALLLHGLRIIVDLFLLIFGLGFPPGLRDYGSLFEMVGVGLRVSGDHQHW